MRKQEIKTKGKKRKIIKKIALSLLAAALLVILVFVVVFGSKAYQYQKEAKNLVKSGGIDIFRASQTSIIYDASGNVITELIGSKDSYYLDYTEIPYFVKKVLIVTEDRNFFKHDGVDTKAVIRALVELVKNEGEITQGGSTITQQLARNVFLSHDVTWERKVREMFVAKELEETYSKSQILEFYINNIYFANGYYGIEAAARGYFGVSVSELSVAQMAFLCAIPNNPSKYDPYIHPENTQERKVRILDQMLELGEIDKEMYEDAINATIVLVHKENDTVNYVETYVRYCATEALMKQRGFEFRYRFADDEERAAYDEEYSQLYNECSRSLYTGGYRIYTSIDLEKQEYLQSCIDNTLGRYTGIYGEDIYEFQGAATCIDNRTGKVVAIVGGRSQEYAGYTLNRGYQSARQPGSSIKPLLVYTPVLERGYTPESIVTDEKIEDGPVNSPDIYEGQITLRRAVEVSKNTVAWDLFGKMTASVCIDYLLNMEFERIVEQDYGAPTAIGGMTYGVTTEEMASGYAAIVNRGQFRSPTCITKITDADNNILIDNINYAVSSSSTVDVRQVYTEDATKMMTDMLMGVLRRGTGKDYQVANAICAAKTGTTNGVRDVWMCGYSAYYTTAVWTGYDMPRDISDGYGNTTAGLVWQQFMTHIHEGLETMDFSSYIREDGTGSDGNPMETPSETESQSMGGGDVTVDSEGTTQPFYTEHYGEGQTQGPMESQSEELTQRQTESQSENQTQGQTESQSEEPTQRQTESQSEEPTQGQTEKQSTEQDYYGDNYGGNQGADYNHGGSAGIYTEYWGE